MKAIFSYYTSTVKLTAEGDVHLSDEALSGLGMTSQFLIDSLFGAITQIYTTPPRTRTPTKTHSMPEPTPSEQIDDPASLVFEDEDPHMPLKPARRKDDSTTSSQMTPASQTQDDEQDPQESPLTEVFPLIGYFAAGGLSGITSRTATAPLDRLKVYLIAQTGSASEAVQAAKGGAVLQATKHGSRTLWNACKELWAAGGIRSLFAGTISLLRQYYTVVGNANARQATG